jgi:uncharacterized membrane protein YqjE
MNFEDLRNAALETGPGGTLSLPADDLLRMFDEGFALGESSQRVVLHVDDWRRVLAERDELRHEKAERIRLAMMGGIRVSTVLALAVLAAGALAALWFLPDVVAALMASGDLPGALVVLVLFLALIGLWRAKERCVSARISTRWNGPRNGGGK